MIKTLNNLVSFIWLKFSITSNPAAQNLPCVITQEKLTDQQLSYVGFDNHSSAFNMTEYLILLGHKRIGLLIGPTEKSSRIKARLEGYQAALEKYEIEYNPDIIIERVPSLTEGEEAARALIEQQDRPSAIFAASDSLAIGALSAAKDKGLLVPRDISIAGFDDVEFASHCDPPLTTIKIPALEIGKRALTTLLEIIDSQGREVRKYDLKTELIIRKSCSAPS